MTRAEADGGDPFARLRGAAAGLAVLPCPWLIAGGWAIDLFLERVTRAHGDVDAAVYRHDQARAYERLRADGWSLEKVVDGRLRPWRGERLDLPVHEVHARRAEGDPSHLKLLLNEGDAAVWRYRRAPAVTRPRAEAELRSGNGISFLAPEVVLLYKSARPAARDEQDFASCLPALGAARRAWLREALASADPRHPWVGRL